MGLPQHTSTSRDHRDHTEDIQLTHHSEHSPHPSRTAKKHLPTARREQKPTVPFSPSPLPPQRPAPVTFGSARQHCSPPGLELCIVLHLIKSRTCRPRHIRIASARSGRPEKKFFARTGTDESESEHGTRAASAVPLELRAHLYIRPLSRLQQVPPILLPPRFTLPPSLRQAHSYTPSPSPF